MARKNVLRYEVATAKSMATTFTTAPTLIKYLDNCSYQINITTTNSIGTFAVEVSDDFSIEETTNIINNAGNWSALTLSGTPFSNAANDTVVINISQMPFNAMRLVYTPSVAGTGHCDVWVNCKQLGA